MIRSFAGECRKSFFFGQVERRGKRMGNVFVYCMYTSLVWQVKARVSVGYKYKLCPDIVWTTHVVTLHGFLPPQLGMHTVLQIRYS